MLKILEFLLIRPLKPCFIQQLNQLIRLICIAENIPSVDALIPFLEVSQYQEYVVRRITELASGGAMSAYRWNSGGRFKGEEWTDKFPTDAEIVMNCVASYLDMRMPSNYVANPVDGRPFTGTFFVRQSSAASGPNNLRDKAFSTEGSSLKNDATRKSSFKSKVIDEIMSVLGHKSVTIVEDGPEDPSGGLLLGQVHQSQSHPSEPSQPHRTCAIVQTNLSPPHYVIRFDCVASSPFSSGVANDNISRRSSGDFRRPEVVEVSPGRHNLFHALLLFLHHVKTKEDGMLGRINLGMSGINVLWVVE